VAQVVQPAERAFLSEKTGVRPADIGPGIGVAGPLDHARDVEAPALRTASRVAQALERDPQLDLVTLPGDPALGLPGEVRVRIGTAGNEAADLPCPFTSDPIALNTERVHPEEERPSSIVEGVDVQHHVVVVVDVVAVGNGGTD
jgi:hypothetical protein